MAYFLKIEKIIHTWNKGPRVQHVFLQDQGTVAYSQENKSIIGWRFNCTLILICASCFGF